MLHITIYHFYNGIKIFASNIINKNKEYFLKIHVSISIRIQMQEK